MATSYDAIIIGSGPNGLAAAIELAQNGRKVLVVERMNKIGGGTQTQELTLPNFHHDYCSAVHPMGVLSPYLNTLPLEKFGLEWIYPTASVAHPLDNEPALLTQSLTKTAANLGEDKAIWRNLFEYFVKNGTALLEDGLKPLGIPKHPFLMARFGMKAFLSAKTYANFKFKSKGAKALFAGCAAHSVLLLDFSFTSALGLMFVITGHMVNWPVVKGGSSRLTQAMAAYFKGLGGEIRTSFWVKNLKDLPPSKSYLFDIDPRQLALIAVDELPTHYKNRLLQYHYGPGVFKVDWALKEAIPWKDARCLQASTVHIGGTLEEIALSERMAWEGKHCDKPFDYFANKANLMIVAHQKQATPIATFQKVLLWTEQR